MTLENTIEKEFVKERNTDTDGWIFHLGSKWDLKAERI